MLHCLKKDSRKTLGRIYSILEHRKIAIVQGKGGSRNSTWISLLLRTNSAVTALLWPSLQLYSAVTFYLQFLCMVAESVLAVLKFCIGMSLRQDISLTFNECGFFGFPALPSPPCSHLLASISHLPIPFNSNFGLPFPMYPHGRELIEHINTLHTPSF